MTNSSLLARAWPLISLLLLGPIGCTDLNTSSPASPNDGGDADSGAGSAGSTGTQSNGGIGGQAATGGSGGIGVATGDAGGTGGAGGDQLRDAMVYDGGEGAAVDAGRDAYVPAECDPLDHPTDGSVSMPSTVEGTVAEYSCDVDFGLVGVASRVCQDDVTWSGEAPSCAPGDCDSLASPDEGTVTTPTGTTLGSIATYACNAGYTLVGGESLTCQAGKTWSGAAPTCQIVSCGALPALAHGTIATPDGTTFGEVATYACNTGYYRVGSATRSCQADGMWSGSAATCSDANTEGLRLTRLHVGNGEYVRFTNTGSQTATLNGPRIEVRDSSGATYVHDFAGGTLAAGASARLGDAAASPDYELPLNLSGDRAAAVLLCATSPCSSSTVLDAMTFEGAAAAPALPSGVSINAPLHGVDASNEHQEDFFRVAYTGDAPVFSSCDWSAAVDQPLFVTSFECGLSGWTNNGVGTFSTSDTNPSGDGSARTSYQTGGTLDAVDGLIWTFDAAIQPAHIEFWMQGGSRVFFGSATWSDLFAVLFQDYVGNICLYAGTAACRDTPDDSWSKIEFRDLDWATGTLDFYVNGTRIGDDIVFGTNYVDDSGMTRVSLTGGGGRVDGIRIW